MLQALALIGAFVLSASIPLKADVTDETQRHDPAARVNESTAAPAFARGLKPQREAAALMMHTSDAAKTARRKSRSAQTSVRSSPDETLEPGQETPQHVLGKFWGLRKPSLGADAAAVALPVTALNKSKILKAGSASAFWKTLKSKASDSAGHANTKAFNLHHGAQEGHVSGKSGPPQLHRRKEVIVIVVIIVVVALVSACMVGLRMRTRSRGAPLVGDAKIQKEFSDNQGPPPHLRVRHWLTGDSSRK
mmetsp:Transcript_74440/g.172494  ORF Transcript_74440/g.172494 Transcript_74440/m.172494 type:complete len:249 (+) Transcript_74440:96-842(+)|eukprot:CAMPEP_0171105498 /NCGR_PEP_ID=MMETSP0766_2-20121228/62805_1 /TAXON_ID=439317 /ORGANISM="Gambierdiscus australes, Strain CAWD 149" /LENGTH=248 /DNA_ID=CAMNT_0011566359 /DNA_START=94 /DNA_END=840 /DNA_ORIENTATION=-